MIMLVYIIKSTACLALLFLFYKVFLERENMHVFKRFYLLGSLVLALLIPALVFTEYVEAAPVSDSIYGLDQVSSTTSEVIQIPAALATDVLDIAPVLWTIYFLGVLFFGLQFLRNLVQILRRIQKNPKQRLTQFTQVLLQEKIAPHTFFSYIFLNKTKLESNQIPKEVLLHEETHAQQKHSWDVVFVEALHVIFWVNPFVYLLKKAIKLNHEFLADQAVLKKDIDKVTYQNTLLSYLSPDSEKMYHPKLANAINYSSIKKRFTIMKTHTSKKAIYLRTLLLLPLLSALLYGFSETKTIQRENSEQQVSYEKLELPNDNATPEMILKFNYLAKKYNQQPKAFRVVPIEDLRVLENIYEKMSEQQKAHAQSFPDFSEMDKPLQDGASRKLMAEYNKLAKYYNEMPRNNMKIKKKDVDRLEHIYSLMSAKQKGDAEPFPDFPPMPEPPAPPKAPKVKKGEKSDIPPPPKAPDHEKMVQVMELEEVAEIRAHEMLMEQEEAKLEQQEILMETQEVKIQEKEEVKLEQQEILMETQEVKMREQQIRIKEEEVRVRLKEVELEEIEERAYRKKQEEASAIPEPPTPPSPETPLDHAIEMAKEGATFYYKKEKISSDEAIAILKKNEDLSMDISKRNNESPVVKIDTHF